MRFSVKDKPILLPDKKNKLLRKSLGSINATPFRPDKVVRPGSYKIASRSSFDEFRKNKQLQKDMQLNDPEIWPLAECILNYADRADKNGKPPIKTTAMCQGHPNETPRGWAIKANVQFEGIDHPKVRELIAYTSNEINEYDIVLCNHKLNKTTESIIHWSNKGTQDNISKFISIINNDSKGYEIAPPPIITSMIDLVHKCESLDIDISIVKATIPKKFLQAKYSGMIEIFNDGKSSVHEIINSFDPQIFKIKKRGLCITISWNKDVDDSVITNILNKITKSL